MARGGSNPGERRGGRRPGSRNKATVERELQAGVAQVVIDANPATSPIELAKDVLGKMMKIAEGAAGLFQPKNPESGRLEGIEDWDRFGQWLDRTIVCAKELAKYQSPQFRAILVTPPPPQELPRHGDGAKVIDINDPVALERVYKRMLGVGRS